MAPELSADYVRNGLVSLLPESKMEDGFLISGGGKISFKSHGDNLYHVNIFNGSDFPATSLEFNRYTGYTNHYDVKVEHEGVKTVHVADIPKTINEYFIKANPEEVSEEELNELFGRSLYSKIKRLINAN